jgi:hypothetical protein
MMHVLALILLVAAAPALAGPPCDKMPQHSGGFQKHCATSTTSTPPPSSTTTTVGSPALDIGTVCGAPAGASVDPFVTLAPGQTVRCLVRATNSGTGTLNLTALELAIHHVAGDVVDRVAGGPLGPGASQTLILDSTVAVSDQAARCNQSLAACDDDADCLGEFCLGFCADRQDGCPIDAPPPGCACVGLLPATAAVEVGSARSTFGAGVAVALP